MSSVTQPLKSIEINLLREETRSGGAALLKITLAAVALGGLLVPGWLWFDAKQEVSRLDGLIIQVNNSLAKAESELNAAPQAAGADLLVTLPDRLQQSQAMTTKMLDRLNALIPIEVNVNSINYLSNGRIQLTGAFASTEYIVTLLNEVEKSEFFSLLSLGSMMNVLPEDGSKSESNLVIDLANQAPEAAAPPAGTEKLLPMTLVTMELEYQPSPSMDGTGGSQ